ncbi:MAG: hypothetical protein K0S07_1034, partial [Chlamydiales bacterium]|nr:hypothetical protein [Chlamydiales bacterium]
GQWQLKNESLYRKIIVTEAHLGIILSDAQIDLIEKMVENPSAWYELKVGLGKTSVVLPLVLLQLIEKGERPTALVKEELLQQNLDSLDLSTRELLAKAGIHFSFRLNAPISAASLEEEYLRLLECAKNGGYPITSASSLIDIDHKLSLLERALQEEEKRLASLPPLDLEDMSDETEETLSSRLNLEELQKQLHYLLKIRSYFDLLLVDEADDVLKITSERNVSLGEPAPLNQTIQETLHHLMRQVFTAEDPTIQLFRRALQEGQQAALSLTFLEETLLPSLVDALLKDAAYRQFLLVDLETDLTPFIDYISKVFSPEDTPPQSSLSPEIQKKLGALKHLVQSTLKTTIRQNPGIDVGLKKSDGFQIGPQVSGQEKLGTVFGDEYDLLANHYLYYGMHLPERGATQAPGEGFVEKALRQIQSQHPQTYRRWQELAQGQDLVSFLNEPEQFELRLDFLRLELLQEQRLQLFPRQMVYNVQDISYGRRIGGMTGTLNSNALPPINGQAEESAPKIVPGQVILEVGLLGVPQVSSMSDEEVKVLETMALAAENGKNKALINQGFALKEGSSQDVVAFIRKRAKERIFVFVDAEDRRPRIWYPKDKEPQPISKGELNRLAGKKEFKELACFYFAPPDTRGTDFRIPAGNGVAFISPKCSLDDFIQSVGRMRGAAEIHRLDFFVSEGACQRMGKEPLSYGALISDIDQQNNELEKNENLKTACEHLKRIGKMGSRHLCFNLQSSHIRQQLQAAIADPKIGWLEEQKGHAFAFSPSIYEPVEVMAERIYKAEVKKFQKLKEAIENLTLPEEAAEGPLSLGELKKVLIESYYHLEEELKEAYEQLLAKLQQEGGQTFHKMVPSSGANLPNAHAQVQEVVQQNNLAQQQMQQLQTQKTERIRALPFASSNPANRLEYVPPAAFLEYHPDPGSLPVPEISNFLEQAFQFEGLESFTVSSKLLRLIFQLGGAKGNLSLCYIGVFMDEIHLMSRENYLTSHVGSFHDIYSLVNPLTYGESLLLDQTRFKVDGHRKDDPYPLREDMLVHIVQAKWFLGAVDYTEEELKRLKPFLREIAADEQLQNGHWLFLEHFGSQEQRQLLSQLL